MQIDINGVIVGDDDKWIYDYYEIDAVCPKDVKLLIAQANPEKETINVRINSGGGDLIAGLDIYSALREYEGEVKILAIYAASAASVILCAGYSEIPPPGMVMMHNVSSVASGDYHAMDKASETLQMANRAISAAYQEKTKKTEKEILELLDKETWLTARDAVEIGLVDKISESHNSNSIKLAANMYPMFSASAIAKLKNAIKQDGENELKKKMNLKLKLLKLGGKR